MASSFNAGRIVQKFAEEGPKSVPLASRVGKIIMAPGASVFKIAGNAIGGTANTLTSGATSASLSDAFSFEASFTLVEKYIKHTIPLNTLKSDYALDNVGTGMANAINKALDDDFFAMLSGLFAAAHPRAGAGAGQVGAGLKYLSAGLAYLQGEGGAGTQDNLITSALDETSLNTAIKLMLQYRADRGHAADVGVNGGLVLCVAPKNAKIAHELVTSVLSGSDMASNFVRGLVADVVVSPYLADVDEDDWFLVDLANSPVGITLGAEPTVEVNVSDDGLFAHIVGKYTAVSWYAPYEAGIIGSNVA